MCRSPPDGRGDQRRYCHFCRRACEGRLGAIVSATDVRPATKEQVESLGGTFIAVMDEEFKNAHTAGGYAKEMSKEYQAKQAALIAETIKKQDIIITTALIPGRKAPLLVTEEMIKTMKPGSVIVDLAAEAGGNTPLTRANEVIEVHGVTIMGYTNLPGRLAVDFFLALCPQPVQFHFPDRG